MKVFSVRDIKSGLFMTPFFQRTSPEAIRAYEVACNDSQTMMCKFPADFELFCLADYDESRGTFKLLDAPQFLCSALDVKSKSSTPDMFSNVSNMKG